MPIHFGTDGWRAVISDTFTFDNLRILTQAIADAIGSDQTTGAGVPVSGFKAPSICTVVAASRPGTANPGFPIPTVRSPRPAGTLMVSRRASDWKSPPSPVRNCQE